MDSRLRKYLESGYPLHQAAACAGLPYEEARKQLTAATDDSDFDAQRMALSSRAMDALNTLSDLLGADDEKVRLGAAKTLLELQTKHKPRRLQLETGEHADDLWTLASRRSIDGQRREAGELEQMDGSGPEESLAGAVSRADDGSQAASADHVTEDGSLSGRDAATRLFDLDAKDTPTGTSDAEDVGPASDGTSLSDSSRGASAPGDPLDGQPDGPNPTLLDYL